MKLYEIEEKYRAGLESLPVSEDGEILDEAALESLERLEGDLKDKLCAVGAFIRELGAEADAIKAAYIAMQVRERALRNQAEWLKGYARETMSRTGLTKAESPFCRVSLGKPGKKVDVVDPAALPGEFVKVRVEPDKAAIKNALKAGTPVPGARLVDGDPVLRIS